MGVIGPSSGVFSILLTDPPSVPVGVSAVYLTYSSLAVHVDGLGDSGWVQTGGHGTINTLGLVNLSRTISTGNIPAFSYDKIAFNVTSAIVTFDGANYTATVSGGKLVITFVGDVDVGPAKASAAIVDIQPTVLNLGTMNSPDFTVTMGAKAFPVPSSEVTESMSELGSDYPLTGSGWFQSLIKSHADVAVVSGLSLSGGSFSFKANNNGSDPVVIKMIVLVPVAHGQRYEGVPQSVAGSIVFRVEQNGSLVLLGSSYGRGEDGEYHFALEGTGYQLAPGGSFTFTFTGTIPGVTSGSSYYVIVLGSHLLSGQDVTSD